MQAVDVNPGAAKDIPGSLLEFRPMMGFACPMNMDRMHRAGYFMVGLLGLWWPLSAASAPQDAVTAGVQLRQLSEGHGVIWGMAFIADHLLLFTERGGRAGMLDTQTGEVHGLDGLPAIRVAGQGGLLDVAVPRGFEPGGWIYFTYVKAVADRGVTVLARARRSGARLTGWQDLLVTRSATSTDHHFGSRIAFDDDGHVYFGVGDRGMRPNAQDLTNHAGCVMRLNLDGSVPADNPFVDHAGALPEIWSYGHRNPQGLSYDAQTGRLWEIEHGPRGGDEINLLRPGHNYGWPVISYGKEYWGPVAVGEGTHKPGMDQPVKQYTPSIAPGSLLVYRGKAFPQWNGNLFAGALKLRHLNRVQLDADGNAVDETRMLSSLHARIRALAVDHQGRIYLSTDSGGIWRLSPRSKMDDETAN